MKTIIVLGGGLSSEYTLNTHTTERFKKALSIAKREDQFICSSDKSYRKLEELRHTSEARVGKAYLMRHHIPEKNIWLEEKSRDTFSNAYFCRTELIDPHNIQEFIVVTSEFHMPKAKLVFDLVFPPSEYTITYVSSQNGAVNSEQLKNRIISEQLLVEFYATKLSSYGITPGNMQAIKNYMFAHNPSFTGVKDKLHQELTQKIKEKIKGNPLY